MYIILTQNCTKTIHFMTILLNVSHLHSNFLYARQYLFSQLNEIRRFFSIIYFSLSVRADAIKGVWLLGISSACNRDD